MSRETTVIAEIGPNHHADWERAREMIVAAAEAGADIAKFQSYRADQVGEDSSEREWFEKVELPNDVHHDLLATARDNGIEFLSSPFSVERARFLVDELGLGHIKVASSELVNDPMLKYLDENATKVYLSTGLSTMEEVQAAVDQLRNVDCCVMQCTSEYPCPTSAANLDVIETYQSTFPDCTVGYSDHTPGVLAPAVAVSKGASVIEKHFTIDKSMPGPDQKLSLEPGEMREMIGRIEQVERLRGQAKKEPTAAEREQIETFRNRFRNTTIDDAS